MTRYELCKMLDGVEYPVRISSDIIDAIKGTDLVIVFGASDDLMEFSGAINDEVGCYDGGTAYLNSSGLIDNECSADDCPYHEQLKDRAATIEALWAAGPEFDWTYKTDIPHSTFVVVEDSVG